MVCRWCQAVGLELHLTGERWRAGWCCVPSLVHRLKLTSRLLRMQNQLTFFDLVGVFLFDFYILGPVYHTSHLTTSPLPQFI